MKTTLQTPSALRQRSGQAAWWRFPIMWLVVAGPLAVVVAGFVTAWIAIDGADASLPNVPPARGVARSAVNARSDAPAQQARNHVATPAPTPAAADSTEPTARRP